MPASPAGLSHRLAVAADLATTDRALRASLRVLELAQRAMHVQHFLLVTRGGAARSSSADHAPWWPGIELASAWGVLRTAKPPQVLCGGHDRDAAGGASRTDNLGDAQGAA